MHQYAPIPQDPAGTFAEWELRAVAAEVNVFLARFELLRRDADAILWECLMHWYARRDRYTPSRGANERTFLNRVIGNKLLDIVDRSLSDKEKFHRQASSIDLPMADVEDLTLAELLADDDPLSAPEDMALAAEVREAIDRVIARLAERDRDLAQRLREGHSVSEISRETGRSRGAIYDAMARIRPVFEDEGLAVFLD